MKNPTYFIGVDVSKKTVDMTIFIEGKAIHEVVKNTRPSVSKYLKTLFKKYELLEADVAVGIENTGNYSLPTLEVFAQSDVKLYLLSPLHINKSLGLVRGKTDIVDSMRISQFLAKNYNELEEYIPKREVISELSLLLSRRSKLQKLIRSEKSTMEALCCVKKGNATRLIISQSKADICYLNKQIKRIEEAILLVIKEDQKLTELSALLQSIPGVGKVLSWYLLIKTNEFKSIKDPRKLACFAGVAPFEYSSGSSVRGRTKVSVFADKTLKRILHMAAMRASTLEGELRDYYLRKVEEGKNKMSVLNALRNKLIHRIIAVINRNQPYQKKYQNHLLLS
jgi:transposase